MPRLMSNKYWKIQKYAEIIDKLTQHRWDIIEKSKQCWRLRILVFCKERLVKMRLLPNGRSKQTFIKRRSQNNVKSMLDEATPKWSQKHQRIQDWCKHGAIIHQTSIKDRSQINVEKWTSKNWQKSAIGGPRTERRAEGRARLVSRALGRGPGKRVGGREILPRVIESIGYP